MRTQVRLGIDYAERYEDPDALDAAVSLFYIKSHFQKNHIADDPEDWVWHTANTERIATLMFLEDAELRKELSRCDQVDLPIARATALQLRDSK